MVKRKRSIYETLAELTGENQQDVKIQMEQSLQRFADGASNVVTVISGSFPESWPAI